MPVLPPKYKIDWRIDNMGYWKRMAELGLVPVAAETQVPPAVYKSSKIMDAGVATPDSPDIPVTTVNSTQSENSVFISPGDRFTVLNSNNSSPDPYPGYFFGADDFFSTDGGENWEGQVQGAGTNNRGDPSTAINSSGRWFVGYIHSGGGQAISYSDDGGQVWKVRAIASSPPGIGSMLDKSHLWVDNSPSSPYNRFLYDGWTNIGGPDDGEISIARSMDNGLAWQMPVKISDSAYARSHNQGVNIATGPAGEVYAVWSIYDNFPGDEAALGFASSANGGQNWKKAHRIIDNIRGIRLHGVNKTMRVNSFPSMAVDNSNSPWRGTIYVVWANVNFPGVNTGTGIDVFMIRSSDKGEHWSAPVRVNQDRTATGKQHFFPWITCDPANGNLSVIFYDDRDTPAKQTEAWVATSTDGGNNWQDFRVSDVSFTPYPVTGLSDDYFGDYLGIAARQGMVYPCWTDNRSGSAMAYVSPFRLGPPPGQPYMVYQSNSYNDTLTGNGDGVPDYGEAATLGLRIRNMGDQPDSSVMVTLGSESPYISFSDSTEFFGDFLPAESKSLADAFNFHISETIPDNTRVVISVRATDNRDSTYISYFSFTVKAPKVTVANITVNDSATNNSGSFDPGETAYLVVKLVNHSQFTATSVNCSLQSGQPFVHILNPSVSVGDLLPGQAYLARFPVKVDSVFPGTVAGFLFKATYCGHTDSLVFSKKIGIIFEDWESGNFRKFAWTFSGNHDWKIESTWQYEGNYCARSGNTGKNQKSVMAVNFHVLTNDSISFYRKISSEEDYDFLSFYIDDLRVGLWSGEMDWKRVTFPVAGGYHKFIWEYSKDPDVSSGLDAAYVDLIEFPSIPFTTANAGKDASIFECQNFTCLGEATFYDSVQWVSTGTGTFADARKLITQYSPSQSDKEAGAVTLILKVTGSSWREIAIDSMNLEIVPKPIANAGPDAGICAGETFRVVSASVSNCKFYQWASTGKGSFDNHKLLMPVYTPDPLDTVAGKVDLVLIAIASAENENCGIALDTLTLTIYPLPYIPLPEEYLRCEGYTAALDATTFGATSYEWIPGGRTTPILVIDTADVETSLSHFTVNVTGEHGCKSSASTRVIFDNCSQKKQLNNVFFRIFPNPVQSDLNVEMFADKPESVSIQICSPDGKIIVENLDIQVTGQFIKTFRLSEVPHGNYVLTIRNREETATQKFIVL